jgi:hypothetical protein
VTSWEFALSYHQFPTSKISQWKQKMKSCIQAWFHLARQHVANIIDIFSRAILRHGKKNKGKVN